MVRPMLRNRTFRRVYRKTPGGKVVLQHKRRKPSAAHCAHCGIELLGVPKALPYKMENMPKSQKRPERPYGGVLCSSCARSQIVARTRAAHA